MNTVRSNPAETSHQDEQYTYEVQILRITQFPIHFATE